MYVLKVVHTPCPSPAQSCERGGASKSSAAASLRFWGSPGTRAPLPTYLWGENRAIKGYLFQTLWPKGTVALWPPWLFSCGSLKVLWRHWFEAETSLINIYVWDGGMCSASQRWYEQCWFTTRWGIMCGRVGCDNLFLKSLLALVTERDLQQSFTPQGP